jgi:hypothetical protein
MIASLDAKTVRTLALWFFRKGDLEIARIAYFTDRALYGLDSKGMQKSALM